MQCRHLGDHRGVVGILWRDDRDVVARRKFGDAVEPDGFARIVRVCDHANHIHAMRQQHREATHAYVMVGEHNGAAHSFRSRIASTR